MSGMNHVMKEKLVIDRRSAVTVSVTPQDSMPIRRATYAITANVFPAPENRDMTPTFVLFAGNCRCITCGGG